MPATVVGAEWGVATTASVSSQALPAHNVTAGNDILFYAVGRATTAPTNVTPSDTVNTYNKVCDVGNGVLRLQVWRAKILTTVSLTITATPTTSSGLCAAAIEVNSLNPLASDIAITNFDASNNNAPHIGPSGTTLVPNEFMIAVACNSSGTTAFSAQAFSPAITQTLGTTWLATTTTCAMQAAWGLTAGPATQSYSATTSTTVVWNTALATFETLTDSWGEIPID